MLGIDAAAQDMEVDSLAPSVLAAANINPMTRLATDYLNHFNNVVMLLDLISAMPECAQEVLDWKPLDYPSYFAVSHFRQRDLAIAAYYAAEPCVRGHFNGLVCEMNAAMAAAQGLLAAHSPADPETDYRLRQIVRGQLRPLLAEASGVVNGTTTITQTADTADAGTAQQTVDELFT